MVYTPPMETTNMKVRRLTLKRLKLLAALQEDTMLNLLDRLVAQALAQAESDRKKREPDADPPRVQN